MIQPHELENRGPDPKGAPGVQAAIRRVKGKPETDPPTLAERITTAKAIRPPREAHCGCCFGQGRDAAIQAIEGAP